MADKSIGDMDMMAKDTDDSGRYTLSEGSTFGQYRIIRALGRGGMGEVYEAEHTTLEVSYALKLLPSDFRSRPEAVERFRREARIMDRLEHPNIVKVCRYVSLQQLRFPVGVVALEGLKDTGILCDYDEGFKQ